MGSSDVTKEKHNKQSLSQYGLRAGWLSAFYGSLLYSFLVSFYAFILETIEIARGENYLSIFETYSISLFGFLFMTILAFCVSVLPGDIGGKYLAFWLSKGSHTSNQIVWKGIMVGSLSGLVLYFFLIAVNLLFSLLHGLHLSGDILVAAATGAGLIGFLIIGIAALMGAFTAKKLKKLIDVAAQSS